MWAQRVSGGPRFLAVESCAADYDLLPLNAPTPLLDEAEVALPYDTAVPAGSA